MDAILWTCRNYRPFPFVKTPDGTLKSKKSLSFQTGKQVAGDADLTLDSAKNAVKNLLKRDQQSRFATIRIGVVGMRHQTVLRMGTY